MRHLRIPAAAQSLNPSPPAPPNEKTFKLCSFCGKISRAPSEGTACHLQTGKSQTAAFQRRTDRQPTWQIISQQPLQPDKLCDAHLAEGTPVARLTKLPESIHLAKTPRRPPQLDKLYGIRPADTAVTKLAEATTEIRRNDEAFGILRTVPYCFPAIVASSQAHFPGLLRRA